MSDRAQSTTSEVIASFAATPDARLAGILRQLTRHLHDFVRESELTVEEWSAAVEFLTEVGRWCSDTRQEFILLSDVLGVSSVVESLNGQEGGTESTVLGPFHMTESPRRALGDSISSSSEGSRTCVMTGTVRSSTGAPLPGASIDVWQCDSHGYYDVQQPGLQAAGNGRGMFQADEAGRYWFRTVVPSHYPIPTDGPVGRLLAATQRHPYRPAHVHFLVSAEGHRELTTHAFVANGLYIDSDAVFAVKESLLVDFEESADPDLAARYGVPAPFIHAVFDIVLEEL